MINEIIEKIYHSEIPCRLEWMYDMGFTWSIQNHEYPRLWIDEDNAGAFNVIEETPESILHRLSPLPEIDWIERGNADKIEDAVLNLALAICKHFPRTVISLNGTPQKITNVPL